eukprot:3325398-Rhodomonas_salina.1
MLVPGYEPHDNERYGALSTYATDRDCGVLTSRLAVPGGGRILCQSWRPLGRARTYGVCYRTAPVGGWLSCYGTDSVGGSYDTMSLTLYGATPGTGRSGSTSSGKTVGRR